MEIIILAEKSFLAFFHDQELIKVNVSTTLNFHHMETYLIHLLYLDVKQCGAFIL